jgi:uncharacterized protein YlaN (UPF0358 family)
MNRYDRGQTSIGFNYGRSGYTKTKSKKYSYYNEDYYSSGTYNSGWSWGNFGGSNFEDDDDKDLYIKSSESYFTPKSDEIGLKIEYIQNTKKNRDLIKEMSRFFYYKMMEDNQYFDERFDTPELLTEQEMETLSIKKSYYQDLWDKFVPGISPLEKAMSVFKQLYDETEKGGAPEASLEKAISMMEFDERVYNDPIYNEILDTNLFGQKNKIDILNKISLVMDFGSEFKVEKEVEEKIVANSSIITKKIMRDYSQLHNVELYQRLMPTFNLKLLTKDLIVNVPVDRTEHKQKIIILLDYSGSMSCDDKQKWVVAILVDRLKYAMKEEAEIYFSYYSSKIQDLSFTHIYDRKTALAFLSNFSTDPNGGDTAFGVMVNHIKNQISMKKLCNLNVDLSEDKPEILGIADGQDSVKVKDFGYKTNAISLVDNENEELKQLCLDQEGKYIYINYNSIRSYNKHGKTITNLKK